MKNLVFCSKCGCKILEEYEDLNCHAHNDKNSWRNLSKKGLELFEVIRTRIINEEKK